MRPRGFQGGLPFAYHVGGTNDVKLRLKTDMDYKLRKIWNVVARIEGNEEKDRWVVLGNHRDAWVFGASIQTAARLRCWKWAEVWESC